MRDATYTPQSASIPARVLAFFAANPEEELSRSDIATKFECPASSIDMLLKPAILAGYIAKDRDAEGALTWRKGLKSPPAQKEDPKPTNGHVVALPWRAPEAPDVGGDAPAQPEGDPVPSRPFCCALFSDGRLLLELPGGDVVLDVGAVRALTAYLDRMGAAG